MTLVSEASAKSTEPQPLPTAFFLLLRILLCLLLLRLWG